MKIKVGAYRGVEMNRGRMGCNIQNDGNGYAIVYNGCGRRNGERREDGTDRTWGGSGDEGKGLKTIQNHPHDSLDPSTSYETDKMWRWREGRAGLKGPRRRGREAREGHCWEA